MTTAQDFLMGGGSKTAKFPSFGTSVSGQIVREPEITQQTEFGTGRLLTWDDGSARLQLVVKIQTDERDPSDLEDDGVRAIYVKGKSLTNAVREAVRNAGAKGLEVGGTLTVTYIADGKAERGNPPKLYTAEYRRPLVHQVSDFLNEDPVQDATPASPAPAGQPPAGVDPAVWNAMGADQRASVLAAMHGAR
ncbi:hypothetical protein [Micromonospora sp. DT47]|uniref:hypothetical protein n=1 Tax=Micromonospora sp. DT47 TaxID=3393431 RepID=UPI003CF24C0A